MASKINLPCFCDFIRHIKEMYPDAEHIYVVLDNWLTVHKHEKAMETFKETAIVPVFLPTYSPQSNPIELLCEAPTTKRLMGNNSMMTFCVSTGIVMLG
jgi:transposase